MLEQNCSNGGFMFLVFNKSKIYSYLVALCTVLVLFVAASKLNHAVSPTGNIIETSTNVISNNSVLQTYSNQIETNIIENKNNIMVNE